MDPIRIEDLFTYRFLSEPRFNPSGTKAAFVVSNADPEENCYTSRLWLYENGSVRQLTDLGKERGFLWLDDERILFPTVRSAAEKKRAEAKEAFTSYYVLDLHGGEALPYFTVPFHAGTIKPAGSGRFLISAAMDKRYPDLYKADKARLEEVKKEREQDRDYEVFDELPFWFNGQGVVNGQYSRLFLVTASPFTLEPVSEENETVDDFELVGSDLFYTVNPLQKRRPLYGFTLKSFDLLSSKKQEIFHSEAFQSPALQAVGDQLLLFTTDGKRYGLNENACVYVLDKTAGRMDLLRAEEYSFYNSVGSDCRYGGGRQSAEWDGCLYHLMTRGGNAVLMRLDPDGTDTVVFEKDGCIDAFDICGNTVLAVGLYDMRPQELYAIDLAAGEMKRVSDFNGEALKGRYLAKPEPVSAESEGDTIHGWVLPPFGYDPDKTYPAVFDIHGGPKTVYGPVFYHEMQVWAGKGYFVFFCNPKGSDGCGNAFADIRGGYGETDYRNLMDFTDAVLKAYPAIDKNRVCETGGSYGGFMTNWIIGHTDRFCCAASQRSISNWISFFGVSDIGPDFTRDQTAGDLFIRPEKMWAQSPLAYAKNAVTPTLFIHSDEDYRCPLEQGLQMYSALVDQGVPARLVLFHGENHELSRSGKPLHRQRRLSEITDWFDRYSAEKGS